VFIGNDDDDVKLSNPDMLFFVGNTPATAKRDAGLEALGEVIRRRRSGKHVDRVVMRAKL
jgi:hypothetical protein